MGSHLGHALPTIEQRRQAAREAGEGLAHLMERQMCCSQVDPVALRLFIRAYWSRVSAYAHAIRDEP